MRDGRESRSASIDVELLPCAALVIDEWGTVSSVNALARIVLGSLPELEAPRSSRPPSASVVALVTAARRTLGSRASAEVSFVRSDGSQRILSCRARDLPDGDGAMLVAIEDVTERRRLEGERDRLILLASVGEMLPSVLHEVKNPLAAAMTALEVLIERAVGDGLQTDLHAVLWELRRVKLVLDGVNALDRPLRSAAPGPVDHAVREAARVLEFTASGRGIHIETDVPDLPLLPFDGAKMRAIVFNLVTNSIQASREGDRIRVALRLSETGNALELEVIDAGAGMSPDTLCRCTELFFTTKRRGSGIGLALCKKAVEEAGGSLNITSELGRGTDVRIELPIRQNRARTEPADGASA